MWHIAADTGGTFTDCHAIAPDGSGHRIKVLSSGCLRSSIVGIPGPQEIVVSSLGSTADGFFAGFRLSLACGDHKTCIIAESFSRERGLHFRCQTPHGFEAMGAIVELTTGEAAPVIGARLLTK